MVEAYGEYLNSIVNAATAIAVMQYWTLPRIALEALLTLI